ncbi:REP-associated tyrosine transposase [Catalinimonas niigatensis]|uniref:REP-associated tyrosine transposase n=1 Tax=Catalinimonas niigatensis TaxID=1397264 RepID=UPI002AA2A1F5|nr:transposase [Catalinimonas niigatensis]WPP52283.1 transposase [Catalinimonas niigatensis]
MSELRKANTDHPYFITCTVVQWIDVFTRNCYSDVLIDSLKYCQQYKGLEVYSYVIMPSHIHMIVRQGEGKLDKVMGDFKSFTAKEILNMIVASPQESRKKWLLHMFAYAAKYHQQHAQYMFWQYTKHPVELSNAAIFQQKMDYIHQNPMTAGYVTEAEKWYYSSANPFSSLKVLVG